MTNRSGRGRALALDLTRGTRDWAPGAARLRRWASAALGRRAAGRELSVRLVGRAESRRLNQRWRRIDKPTNVLSFPATRSVHAMSVGQPLGSQPLGTVPLGDLVICPRVVRDEARQQGKLLTAHWAHMVVHGSLHLLGYDHEQGGVEQRRMERREIDVLRRLGFANPYVQRRDTKSRKPL